MRTGATLALALALALASLGSVVRAIDTGRRCCVYMIERPEREWDYNFQTMGVALLKTAQKFVAFDADGYVSVYSYAGDQCYEWDMYRKIRATETPPVGQAGETKWQGATSKTLAGDDSKAYALEIDPTTGDKRVHVFDVATETVTDVLTLHGGPLGDISGNGGMTWSPDPALPANGKFLFSLTTGNVSSYEIDFTTSTVNYLTEFRLPDADRNTDLRGIFVNQHETTGDYEMWVYFRGTDTWIQYSYLTHNNTLTKGVSGSMLTERAHPTRPGALALVHVSGTDVLRVFVGNSLKWIYELHLRRGKGRFMECPWHEKNVQTCCLTRYSSTCQEMTRDDCSKGSHPGTFMGPWKHWNSQKVLCGGTQAGSSNPNPCGIDDITNPSLVPATVTPLPASSDAQPSPGWGYVAKYYQHPPVSNSTWADDIEQLYNTVTPDYTETVTGIYKGESRPGDQWWSGGTPHVNTNNFAATYSTLWHVKTTGAYTFQITCNDACRIYIDNNVVVTRTLNDSMGNANSERTLTAGNHVMFVTMYGEYPNWGFRLKIKGPDTGDSWTTGSQFGSAGAGLYTSGAPASVFELRERELTHAESSFERDSFDDLFFNRVDDDFNWVRNAGQTGSLWTGPNRAFHGNKYVYAEASNRRPGHVARLQSVNFTLGTGAYFSIQHSMYGVESGTLQIDILYNGIFRTVFSVSGQQGAGWDPIVLDSTTSPDISDILVPGQVISFLFTYVTTGGTRGDVALDDFKGFLGTGAGGHGPVPDVNSHPALPSTLGIPDYNEATNIADTCESSLFPTSGMTLGSQNASISDAATLTEDEEEDCWLSTNSSDAYDVDLEDETSDGTGTSTQSDPNNQARSESKSKSRARVVSMVVGIISGCLGLIAVVYTSLYAYKRATGRTAFPSKSRKKAFMPFTIPFASPTLPPAPRAPPRKPPPRGLHLLGRFLRPRR